MATDRSDEWSWAVFFRGVARALGLKGRRQPERAIETDDPWARSTQAPPPDVLSALLDEVERDALAVYEGEGLPTRPGHYARAPSDSDWQFVAETMAAEDRWGLVFDYPPEQGWRFAMLEDLGRLDPRNVRLQTAGRLLSDCRTLRQPPDGRRANVHREGLAAAVRLGVEWKTLQWEVARHAGDPLVFAKPKRLPRRKTD